MSSEPPNSSAKPRARRAFASRLGSSTPRNSSSAASSSTARAGEVALHVRGGADPAAGLGLVDPVAGGAGHLEHASRVGVGHREPPKIELGGRSDRAAAAVRPAARRSAGRVPGWRVAPRAPTGRTPSPPGTPGCSACTARSPIERGTPSTMPELGDQLGGGGGVVGQVLDEVFLLGGERDRHAGVTLRPGALRERLVGDLADDVAVEAPPVAVDVEEAVAQPAPRDRRRGTPGPSRRRSGAGQGSIPTGRARRRCR